MFEPITFSVEGRAVTQGSKNPNVPRYKDGTFVLRHTSACPGSIDKEQARKMAMEGCGCPPMVNVIDDNETKLKPWREAVAWAAGQAYTGEPIDGVPLVVAFEFIKPRPKSHYGTGRNAEVLKDSAPSAPIVKPDALKLARAIEDALIGKVWLDDSLIVTEVIAKRYCHRWEPERVNISIRAAEAATVGDLVAAGMLELPHAKEAFEQFALAI